MSLNINQPVVNPRLGASFAIFTSAFACLIVMLVVLEQLGLSRDYVGQLIIVTPVLFYLAIGMLVRTISVDDFFISGQRVPALYNGLSLSANSLGGVAVLSLTGALFFIGVDALAIGAGLCAGLALAGVLFAANLRKAGAFTLPGYLGLRLASRSVRFVAALLLVAPCLMLMAAEIRLAAMTAQYFVRTLSLDQLTAASGAFAAAIIILGGMRSLTWSQCAQAIVTLFGLLIPIAAVSIMLTNLPTAQFTYGQIVKQVGELELTKGLIESAAPAASISAALPGVGFETLQKPFGRLFSSLSETDFVLLALAVMIGAAALPSQIARLSTTPTVAAVRKSFGWAVLFVGLTIMTLPAYAVFTKFYVAQDVIGKSAQDAPAWAREAQSLGMARLGSGPGGFDGGPQTTIARDAVAPMLPLAARLPYVFFGVAAAAAIAAALAMAASQMMSVGGALSNDVYFALMNRAASPARRLFAARLCIALSAAAAVYVANALDIDPLRLALWALALTGATFFPILLLSIMWARLTAAGATIGMLAGFATTAFTIASAQAGAAPLGLDPLLAGLIGAPIAAAAAIAVSVVVPSPPEQAKEFLEEMRLSAGETLYARSVRLAARGRAQRDAM